LWHIVHVILDIPTKVLQERVSIPQNSSKGRCTKFGKEDNQVWLVGWREIVLIIYCCVLQCTVHESDDVRVKAIRLVLYLHALTKNVAIHFCQNVTTLDQILQRNFLSSEFTLELGLHNKFWRWIHPIDQMHSPQ
jgi:hypothetical protein